MLLLLLKAGQYYEAGQCLSQGLLGFLQWPQQLQGQLLPGHVRPLTVQLVTCQVLLSQPQVQLTWNGPQLWSLQQRHCLLLIACPQILLQQQLGLLGKGKRLRGALGLAQLSL